MRKFTKLWRWVMILLISSSVLVVQAQKNATNHKASVKVEQKKVDQKEIVQNGLTKEQLILLEEQGINPTDLSDKELLNEAELMLLLNTYGEEGSNPEITDAVSVYSFSYSAGAFTPITGGTSLGTETTDDQRFVDPAAPVGGTTLTGVGFPIGFDFTYNGYVFDRLAINANGWISLGQSALTPAVNIASSSSYTPLGSTTAITPAQLRSRIAVLGRDLQAQVGATLRIETIGTTPNQECVIQWDKYRKYVATGDSYSFQIRLKEGSNDIEFVYGTMTSNATSTTVQVGLGGDASTDYFNRSTTTDWAATIAGAANTASCTLSNTVFPVSGTTFTFSPPPPGSPGSPSNPMPLSGAAGVAVNTNLTWDFGVLTDNYDLYLDVVNPPLTKVVDNAAAGVGLYDPPADLSTSTTYYWQVIARNASKLETAGPVWSFGTACGSFTAPFVEPFQNTTIPLCWTMSGPQNWLFTTTWPTNGAAGLTDHTGTGGSFAGVDGSGTAGLTGITLLTPFIDVTPLADPALKFYLFNNNITNTNYQTLRVDLWDGAAWNNSIYFWGPTDDNPDWVEVIVPLSAYTITGDIQIAFVVDKGPTSPFYDDLIIDDVSVDEAPTCLNPTTLGATNIGTYQADLTWVSISGLSDIEFGTFGFVPTGVPTDAGVTSPYTKGSLLASTQYSFYVRDDCGGGDYSDWIGPYSFTTLSDLPYAPFNPSPANLSLGVSVDATLTWDFGANTETYDVYFGTDNPPLTKVVDNQVAGATGSFDPPGSMSFNTPYYWYVVARNAAEAETVGPQWTFTTACASFVAPFYEPFQNTTIPLCWEISGPQNWLFTTTWPGWGATGLTDHTGTGGSFAGVDGSGTAGLTGITLLTPFIDVMTNLTDPALRFYLFNNNADGTTDYQTLSVDLWDGAAWNNGIFFWGPTDNDPNWVEVIVALSPYTITGDIQFRFVVDKGPGSPFYDDVIIDDVYVEEAPACPNPGSLGATNITTAQADLTWTSPSGLSDIEFGIAGFVPTGIPTDAGKTSPYTKMGLSASSSYSFYVRDDCGGGEYSNWVGPYTFNTPCDVFTAPYLQEFTTWPPLCWDLTGGTYSWVQYAPVGGTVQCAEASYWGQTAGNTDIMTTPTIDVSALTAPVLEFMWSHLYNATYPTDALTVFVSDDNGGTWTQVWYKAGTDLESGDGATSTAPGSFISSGNISLAAFGDNVLVQFYGYSGFGPDLFVDNVRIFEPLAHDVATVSIDNVGTYIPTTPFFPEATVFNEGGNTETFDVTMTITDGYSSTMTVTGLTPGTSEVVTFAEWTPGLGTWDVEVCTELATDLNLTNDCMQLTDVVVSNLAWGSGTGALVQSYMGTAVGYTTTAKANMGYLYTIGGNTTSTLNNELSIYDVVNGTWSAGASFPMISLVATSAVVGDKIYHIGGATDGVAYGAQCYAYDIATNTWTAIAPLPVALGWMKAVGYGDNYVYVAGGYTTTYVSTVYLYDILANTWTVATSMPSGVFGGGFSLATETNTLVYVGGASLAGITANTYIGEIDPVNPAIITWTTGTPYPAGPMYRFDAAPWCPGKVIMGGGSPTSAWVPATPNASYVYEPATDTWTAMPNLATAVLGAYTGSVMLDGGEMNFIIASGYNGTATVANTQILSDICGFRVFGNVYYGNTGTAKPMETNTTVTLDPGAMTVNSGALGYYQVTGVADGAYTLTGATTKAGNNSQITTADGIIVTRMAAGLGTPYSNLQYRAGDVNKSNGVTTSDAILIKRRAAGLTSNWSAPVYVFDGPFGPPNPVLGGIPVNVAGSDVTQNIRCLLSGDLNSSHTPPAN